METIADKVNEPIQQMLDGLNVNSVFGAPAVGEDITIIPVANVSYGFGYGFGGDSDDNSGGGGGGGGKATPSGYVLVTPEGVEYEPIENETAIALAGIFTGILTIFWVTKTVMTIANAIARVRTAENS